MSGIAGVLSNQQHDSLPEILKKIEHRGTSSHRIWNGPQASLGATALSALQEKPGPFSMPDERRAIVMDGRLIDQDGLQDLLKFHKLNEGSDTKLVLYAYEERGTRIFGRLEGEFALVIVDGDRFILARDRLGIKPLYYGFKAETLYFASEIKGLIGLVDQIHEFSAGHFLISDQGLYPYDPYFPKAVKMNGALDSAEQLASHLNTAVEKSIPADAEVGVWLSGGVDSSVIAALAHPFVNRLYAFSAGIEGAPDLHYTRQVAQHIGAEYHEHIYTIDEMQEILEKVICHLESFDAPLVHSAVSNYLVSKLASDYVPFVLSGEGGDELFAGYAYQKDYQSEIELTLSVQSAISALHNTALQRVDRSASALSTGVAVPFLAPEVVRYALAIPARWKIRGHQEMEKWPLRQGLVDTLPDEVIWRIKSKFWEGSGSGEMLANFAETAISDEEFLTERDLGDGDQLRSKEELMYYRIFKQHFEDHVPLAEIGRTLHI